MLQEERDGGKKKSAKATVSSAAATTSPPGGANKKKKKPKRRNSLSHASTTPAPVAMSTSTAPVAGQPGKGEADACPDVGALTSEDEGEGPVDDVISVDWVVASSRKGKRREDAPTPPAHTARHSGGVKTADPPRMAGLVLPPPVHSEPATIPNEVPLVVTLRPPSPADTRAPAPVPHIARPDPVPPPPVRTPVSQWPAPSLPSPGPLSHSHPSPHPNLDTTMHTHASLEHALHDEVRPVVLSRCCRRPPCV